MVAILAIARELAAELRAHEGRPDVYVIAVAPESLGLAADIAQRLRVAFDLFPVRALHVGQTQAPPVGIVGSGGMLVIDQAAVATQRCSPSELAESAQISARALDDFEREIRDGAEPPDLRHRTIILLDDGRTSVRILQMTIAALRRCWVRSTTLAIPMITESDLALVRVEADAIVSSVVPDGTALPESSSLLEPISVAEIQLLLRRASQQGAGQERSSTSARTAPALADARLDRTLATSPLGVCVEG